MESLNGSMHLQGSQQPLVVHFANGRATGATDQPGQVGAKRSLGVLHGSVPGPLQKRMHMAV
jgi:hypothetical protein